MTNKEVKSCIGTIDLLRRLAYNIHGVMDVIDANNCEKIIVCLNKLEKIEAIVNEPFGSNYEETFTRIKGVLDE